MSEITLGEETDEMDISISIIMSKEIIFKIISQDSLSCKWLKLHSD